MSDAQIPANPLGTERIGKLLRGFAIPGIISMVINSLYNMVDQVFIGQGVGMLGNGATNIISPISTFAIALSSLFGDGLATYFSLQLGKGEPEKASKAVGTAIIAGTGVSVVLTHYGALSIYGEDIPITVFGLCMKVSMLFFSVAMGISSASRPILGFNYGAEKYDRVKKTFRLTLASATIVITGRGWCTSCSRCS